MFSRILKLTLLMASFIGLLILTLDAFAAQSLGDFSASATESISVLARVMTSGSYMIGFAFAVAAIIKYKDHRDNPTHTTLGRPILLAFIALAFILMPMLFLIYSGKSIFGAAAIGAS